MSGTPLIPYDSNFSRRILWLTVLEAFEKSKKMPHVYELLSIAFLKVSVIFSYGLSGGPSLTKSKLIFKKNVKLLKIRNKLFVNQFFKYLCKGGQC